MQAAALLRRQRLGSIALYQNLLVLHPSLELLNIPPQLLRRHRHAVLGQVAVRINNAVAKVLRAEYVRHQPMLRLNLHARALHDGPRQNFRTAAKVVDAGDAHGSKPRRIVRALLLRV